jgi:DNA modification methylase
MSAARYLIGDSLTVLRSLPDASVQSVISSPPYLAKRSYLPADHPDKSLEIGQENTPGDFLAALLAITDELWRVVSDDGTIWINLGDTASGSGGGGGDYNVGGLRDCQPRYAGSASRTRPDGNGIVYKGERPPKKAGGPEWPLPKSVCWVPELFGASLAYGRNLLTGEPCQQWITRPPVTWCKPNPPVGEIIDKFREATELIVWAAKQPRYYFDLDSVRREPIPENERTTWNQQGPKQRLNGERSDPVTGRVRFTKRTINPKGTPPLTWWEIPSDPYPGAHFAVFPPELVVTPVIASCPPGGTILDPFAGSGTTLAVATGHGRDAIGIDLDERNADLARERVGMWLTVEHHTSLSDVDVSSSREAS